MVPYSACTSILTALLSAFLLLWLNACQAEKDDVQAMMASKKSLLCDMETLKNRSDSLWSDMSLFLEQHLPQDLPPTERSTMVAIKNARLIATVKAFPKLDSNIQAKVLAAGNFDSTIAADMKSVMDSLQGIELKINTALERLEKRDPGAASTLKNNLRELIERPCD
jgi:hypothetical protein